MKHLCNLLETNEKELKNICSDPCRYYRRRKLECGEKIRLLAIPEGRLLEILKKLKNLLQRIELPEFMQGGIPGHSHITNALIHTRKPAILKSDLKDFFPNIGPQQVYNIFCKRLGCTPDVARYLTKLTTIDGSLPQGSPTSTIVSNIVAETLGKRLDKLAKKNGANFSQYCDDLNLSGQPYISRFRQLMIKVIRQEGFTANISKTTFMINDQEQIVTGIRVNNGIDVPRKKIHEVRGLINELVIINQTGQTISEKSINSIRGKITYINQLNIGVGRFLKRQLNKAIIKNQPSL